MMKISSYDANSKFFKALLILYTLRIFQHDVMKISLFKIFTFPHHIDSLLMDLMIFEENTETFFSLTKHPLSIGIFCDKNVTHQHGFESTNSYLPGRRTTNCAMGLEFTIWSNKVEIWQKFDISVIF